MKILRPARVVPACLLACAGFFASSASPGAPLYDITITGLTDVEHTRSDGYQASYNSYLLNPSGQVVGRSSRYNGGSTYLGQSAWIYSGGSTAKVGLMDAEHTNSNGYRWSQANQLNAAGQVAGISARSPAAGLGYSVWFYDGLASSKIGLIGSEFTRNDGYRNSQTGQLNSLNNAGQVIGISERYNGGATFIGTAAWLYQSGTTTRIGLLDAEHSGSGGLQSSSVSMQNAAGQILGASTRYNGGATSLGNTPWVYDAGTTTRIGLTGAAYTRNDGFRQTSTLIFNGLNEAGQVVGMSTRFDGTASVTGSGAWFYGAGTTTDISLTDAEHTRSDGSYTSRIETFSGQQFNQAGQVLGTSNRYNGGTTGLGRTAWLYDGNDASRVTLGFTDAAHTSSTGARSSLGMLLNEAGQVAGTSTRFNGGTAFAGSTAWLYSGGTTTVIGLTDAEHTRDDGRQDNNPQRLNEAGQVAGSATRYNSTDGSVFLGESVWMYDGSGTTRVNPTGTAFTRNDGLQSSSLQSLNEAGQVTGFSRRYNGTDGSVDLGQTAWFYDSTLGQTYDMDFSIRSDGYAFSRFSLLSDAGFALGYYELFDASDALLGNRAIYFSPDDGWLELGSLVDGGLAPGGWDYLADAILANGVNQVIGAGLLNGMTGGQMTYLLTPQAVPVPVPGAVWLLGSGLLGLAGVSRRKKSA